MSYCALYRKYRPRLFKDLVGQEHVVIPLRNQVITRRIAHAYLFSGTRGTGKTSAAKIFAKAINCLDPQEGEPCGKCLTCKSDGEESVDIIEIDAASNNGVDEIRDLREKVQFSPIESAYKVYIVDEVHMLTTGASNALLKTLEEPPAHVVFILATTEPQKLPATILSRCQRYEFNRISVPVIVSRLQDVLKDVGASIDEKGLYAIAYAAQGGLRDALSMADQCIAYYGKDLMYENVIDVLGTMDIDFMFDISLSIIDKKPTILLSRINEVTALGRDLLVLCKELINHFRNIMLIIASGRDSRDLIEVTDEIFERYYLQSKGASLNQIIEIISLLNRAQSDMKYNFYPRIVLESALLKACFYEDVNVYLNIAKSEDNLHFVPKQVQSLDQHIPVNNCADTHKKTSNSTDTQILPSENSAIKKHNECEPDEADKLFSTMVSRQTPGIARMFELFPCTAKIVENTLEIYPSSSCLPTLITKLCEESDNFAKSISDLRSDIKVHFNPPGSKPEHNEDNTKLSPIKQAAADIFGRDKIKL